MAFSFLNIYIDGKRTTSVATALMILEENVFRIDSSTYSKVHLVPEFRSPNIAINRMGFFFVVMIRLLRSSATILLSDVTAGGFCSSMTITAAQKARITSAFRHPMDEEIWRFLLARSLLGDDIDNCARCWDSALCWTMVIGYMVGSTVMGFVQIDVWGFMATRGKFSPCDRVVRLISAARKPTFAVNRGIVRSAGRHVQSHRQFRTSNS